jgi:lauroyl/myristoyl acyltransferase
MRLDGGALLLRVARVVPRLPARLSAALFALGADVTWARRTGGVRQLEANLARVRPDADATEVRRLSRAGMRSYMRYYEEALRLPSVSVAPLGQRVRCDGGEPVRADLVAGRAVVGALGHCGNWDLAGAWATKYLGDVVTVAEKLRPVELFEEFLSFRRGLGMTIIPLEQDGSTFRALLRHARSDGAIIPLLADRDLSRGGVEVTMFGQPARVAAGPATLALATRRPLYAVTIHHERLRGERRRAAGSRWGIRITFVPVPVPPVDTPKDEAVRTLTQAWVDVLTAHIAEHPTDWHMLQKVFVADLDPERLARAEAA